MRTTLPHVLACITLPFVVGCNNFDNPSQLRDLRVLAIQAEPAEIMYSPLYVFIDPADRPPPPFFVLDEYDVRVTAFVYDPRGGSVSTSLRYCPEGTQNYCREYDPEVEVATAPDEHQDEVRTFYASVDRVNLSSAEERERDPSGRLVNQEYNYRFSTPVLDTILRNADGQASLNLFSLLPRFIISAENPALPPSEVNSELAFKRFPLSLNFFDPTLPASARDALLQVLGATLCEGGPPDLETYVEEKVTCLFERGPNQNPRLVGFDLYDPDAEEEERARTGAARPGYTFRDTATLGPRSLIQAYAGATLHIRPVFAPGTREPYQVFGYDLNNQKLTIENRLEDLALEWTATGGSVPADSNTEFGGTIEVSWSLPSRDPGERDAVIVVVRDQRGGVSMGQITVEYR
jgi:hypothetical protein